MCPWLGEFCSISFSCLCLFDPVRFSSLARDSAAAACFSSLSARRSWFLLRFLLAAPSSSNSWFWQRVGFPCSGLALLTAFEIFFTGDFRSWSPVPREHSGPAPYSQAFPVRPSVCVFPCESKGAPPAFSFVLQIRTEAVFPIGFQCCDLVSIAARILFPRLIIAASLRFVLCSCRFFFRYSVLAAREFRFSPHRCSAAGRALLTVSLRALFCGSVIFGFDLVPPLGQIRSLPPTDFAATGSRSCAPVECGFRFALLPVIFTVAACSHRLIFKAAFFFGARSHLRWEVGSLFWLRSISAPQAPLPA
jgi:hypothetical protein